MFRSLLIAFVCTMLLAFAMPAMAQDKPGLKIGVAAVHRVFAEAAEAKDVTSRANQMEAEFKQQAVQKTKDLKDLEQTIQTTLKVGSPQYEEKRKEWISKSIEAKLWNDVTVQELQRLRLQNYKMFFEKLDQAVSEVATKRGLDLILPDMRQPFTESTDSAQDIQRVINSRNVLYATPSIDVTAEVIAAWDTHYKEKK
jgi:Skp family chaperone for outer membrane proteins